MKTVCKKLFSLLLVAALLVSAIPAAFAAEATPCTSHDWVQESIKTPATCSADGGKVMKCSVCGEKTVMTIAKDANAHDWGDWVVTEATCQADGSKTRTCKLDAAHTETVTLAKVDHDYTTVTTDSTCYAEGSKVYTCRFGCGTSKTETIAKKAHTFGADGKCTVAGCNGNDGIARYTVTFFDEVAGKAETKTFVDGTTISTGMLPEGSLKDGKQFIGWYNGSSKLNDLLQNGKWHAGMPTSFTAKYIDSDDDGVSKLYVYVRFYVKGVQQGYTQLLIDPVTFKDGENMFNWLQNNKGTIGAAIEAKDTEDKYDWYPEYFYNYSGDEILTAQTLKSNGDQSVVVKAYAEKAAEADVMVYVHTSKNSTPAAIYEMDGKTAGNTVTLAEVKTLLKNKYSVSEGLYSDKAWTDMLNGMNPMAVNGIDVEDNGTLKIHVLAKAASSNADSSNPKTGDYITVAATTMVLAAAAFVAMVEMKKRKMI